MSFKRIEVKKVEDIRNLDIKWPHKPKSFRKTTPMNTIFDEQYLEDVHETGLEYMDEEEYKKAIKEFNKILDYSVNPEFTEDFTIWYDDAWNHIGECLLELGDSKKALKIFKRLIQDNPDEEYYLFNYALALGDLGENFEASKVYHQILDNYPNDLDVLVNISDEYIALVDAEKALHYANQALKIKPNDSAALSNKGQALLMESDFRGSKKYLEKSIEIDPTDGMTWYAKAACLDFLNADKDDVFDALVVAVALEPEIGKEKLAKQQFKKYSNEPRFKRIFS